MVSVLLLLLTGTALLSNPDSAAAGVLRDILAGGAPPLVHYQGQVTVDGASYSGTGYFKFAIIDQAGTTTYWSNDGSSNGAAEPFRTVPLTVSNGMFAVLLGDPSLPNMTQALSVDIFDDTDRYLRVWFSDDAVSFTQLTPDQRFTSVPYALLAEEAKIAEDADTLDGLDSSAFQWRVSGTCTWGYSIRSISSDGSVTCEKDDGTVYTAGNQLSLSDTTFNVREGPGSGLDADVLDSLESDVFQQRVSGACADGSTIREIASDGTVICDEIANYKFSLPVHRVGVLDSADAVGQHTSIAIGIDGLAIISYYDVTHTALKVAHCDDMACTGATITTVAGSGSSDKGQYNSIAIGSDGMAIIPYFDASQGGDLEVIHCDNVECTSFTENNLVTGDSVGQYTSVTIGTDGRALISYYNLLSTSLDIIHCDNVICSSGTRNENVDNAADVGAYTSITIGVDGYGLVSYYDKTNGNLKTLHCTNTTCSTYDAPNTIHYSEDVGRYSSITLDNTGRGVISYIYHVSDSDERLYMTRCANTQCSSASTHFVDYTGSSNAGKRTAITIGDDGLPFIAYSDGDGGVIKTAHCSDATCSSAVIQPLDTGASARHYPSVSIGMDGMPIISYYLAGSTDNLNIAHCSNALCIPNVRR
jgi:hypothetical protein